jgi:hypothetical protein
VPIERRAFLEACAAAGLTGLLPGAVYAQVDDEDEEITVDHIAAAEPIAGVSFTPEEREMMVDDLNEKRKQYEQVREMDLPNRRRPAEVFDPRLGGAAIPDAPAGRDGASVDLPSPERPSTSADLAYAGVARLGSLLRAGAVTSVELTELYLQRLKQYDDKLHAVISYTEDRAMDAARRADEEIASGNWRGPLHGIPYGAKDLLAVEGTRTTWGATPYQEQVIDETAAVVERLDEAGAVLVAKLSLGALARGDVWYDHKTRNPWNIAGVERIERRPLRCGVGRLRAVCHRERNARLHRLAVHPHRRDRAPAHLRHREPARGHGAVVDDGQAGADHALRPRRRPRLRRDPQP